MKNLQKAGGMCAVIAASTYIFSIGLAFSALEPMADTSLGFQESMAFLIANKSLVFAWHFAMYLVSGACLTVVALAIYERLKDSSPRLAKVASAFGFTWIGFVFLSGMIVSYGNEALIALYGRDQGQAQSLKTALDTVTLGIDSSDRFLGCLWVGLVSLAAFKGRAFARAPSIFGMAISLVGLVGTMIPALVSISYVFGIGAIAWWVAVGVSMLRRQAVAPTTAAALPA